MSAPSFAPTPRWFGLLVLLLGLLTPAAPGALAVDTPGRTAPVVIDGVTLFRVRGVSAFPADERAEAIADRLRAVAADSGITTSTLRVVPAERSADIVMGDRPIMSVVDADAEIRGSTGRTSPASTPNASAPPSRRFDAIARPETSSSAPARASRPRGAGRRGIAPLPALAAPRRHAGAPVHGPSALARDPVGPGHPCGASARGGACRLPHRAHAHPPRLRLFYLSFVLTRFPWTRPTAARLLGYVLTPFAIMGRSLLAFLPNLIFLVILVAVTRWALKVLSLLAAGVERGTISLQGFEREWAAPTYRIVRLAVIGFAAVIAYPYIPGSESAAFKGISIFFGVVFSLGASSVVGNMLAGYSLIYRRTFKVGDRVKIGDVVGDVTHMRLQVTHVRTIKNEDVVVPNSVILTTQVVNYSSYAATEGLVLHTTVGIGYEVPWRQVEAMLLLAASRTPGLLTAPPPFVLQTSLADFAINYELNVHCGDAHDMFPLYTELHRNIQDVFNEYGVQIMTPAYRGDPAVPKVVPKDQWYQAPARTPEEPPPSPTGTKPA